MRSGGPRNQIYLSVNCAIIVLFMIQIPYMELGIYYAKGCAPVSYSDGESLNV